ncbi:MAG: thioredoxin-dependent thiol peroxidase [bacterium]|jgi:peroxiredoxin Q/BCP
MLKPGDNAPSFSLESSKGGRITLESLKGKWAVLYFYPKDNTPGCTVEACGFRDGLSSLTELGAVVLGVSPDDLESHRKFISDYDLNFALLSDLDHEVAEKFGAWTEKTNYGKTYWGIQRSTFLIDPNGKIAHVWPRVKPESHAEEVRAKLEELLRQFQQA